MQFRYRKNIAHFLDTSIIIPIGHDWQAFETALRVNQRYLRRNGLECILALADHRMKSLAMTIPEKYPGINWKIVNAGSRMVQHASFTYLLLLPDTVEWQSDVAYQLRYIAWHYQDFFAVTTGPDHACTGILVHRKALTDIGGGCDKGERRSWLDSTNAQLQAAGIRQMLVPEALTSPIRDTLCAPAPPPAAGPDDNEPFFDWRKDGQKNNITRLLSGFEEYARCDGEHARKHHRLICLIQVRNESRHIPEVLQHLEQHCDGIILLDDGSTDDSYKKAVSEKLLLKVRKRYKGHFDDLENRNLLLQLGALFKTEWFFFADADERFDTRSASLIDICQKQDIDTVSFAMVHLWDHPGKYRTDLPEGKKGLFRRYRMFRNYGYMQIESRREIHFAATPYIRRRYDAAVLVLHAGMMDAAVRRRKYEYYKKVDEEGKKQGYRYDFLLSGDAELGNVREIAVNP